jgi:hypothetical protein
VSYHGGALIPNVSIQPVFYGSDWMTPAYAQQAGQLDTFMSFLTNSSFMDMLNEYNAGRGGLVNGGYFDSGIHSGQTIDATQIQQMLVRDTSAGLLAPNAPNRLYVVYTNPNVVVTFVGGSSLTDFSGFHDEFINPSGQPVWYAVITSPVPNLDFPGLNDFQTLTLTVSHEVAEAVTDPGALAGIDPGGWYGRFRGYPGDQEIADVAEDPSQLATLGGYVIQGVWSQVRGTDVLPLGATYLSGQPGVPPAPTPPSLADVANIFTHGPEHFADLVNADYAQYLGRTPNSSEVNYWVNLMEHGASDEQVLAAFIGSPEYFAHVGGTNQAWVDAMYQDLLHRAPDPAGENFWVQALAAGASPTAVAQGFATSYEAEAIVVQNDYQTYLGRQASSAEVNYWVMRFETGTTNEQVIAGFLSSPEYFNSPTKGQGSDSTWVKSAYGDLFGRQPSPSELNYWVTFLGG